MHRGGCGGSPYINQKKVNHAGPDASYPPGKKIKITRQGDTYEFELHGTRSGGSSGAFS